MEMWKPVFDIHVEVVLSAQELELPTGAVMIFCNRGTVSIVALGQCINIAPEFPPPILSQLFQPVHLAY